jgi:hypothetical protein
LLSPEVLAVFLMENTHPNFTILLETIVLMGFISIRVADFYAGSPNLTQPSTFSHRGLGTGNGSVKIG